MKNLKIHFLLLFAVSLFSCSSSNDEDDLITNVSETFSVDISSVGSFTATSISAQINSSLTFMTIVASDNNGRTITLEIGRLGSGAPVLTEGSYSFNIDNIVNGIVKYEANNIVYNTDFGFDREIVITNIDMNSKVVSGSFSGSVINFAVDRDFTLSNGRFRNISFD